MWKELYAKQPTDVKSCWISETLMITNSLLAYLQGLVCCDANLIGRNCSVTVWTSHSNWFLVQLQVCKGLATFDVWVICSKPHWRNCLLSLKTLFERCYQWTWSHKLMDLEWIWALKWVLFRVARTNFGNYKQSACPPIETLYLIDAPTMGSCICQVTIKLLGWPRSLHA